MAAFRAAPSFRQRFLFLAVLALPTAFVLVAQLQVNLLLALPVIGLVLFSGFRVPGRVARRTFRKHQLEGLPACYCLNRRGIDVRLGEEHAFIEWKHVRGVGENTHSFLVEPEGELPAVLPKRAFQPQDVSTVRDLLRAHTPSTQLESSRIVWALAFGILALLVWQLTR